MKVLLTAINAKYIHSNLAVYSLRAYAGKYAQQTEIAEYTINQPMDDILSDIYKKRPDVLCLIFTGKNRIFYVCPAIYGIFYMWSS